jgi:transposase
VKHITGVDRAQTLLLPETIEDYVAPENPVRFLDAFVASLDLHALGFSRAIAAYTGRPAYDPGVLLRLYLYGYLHRIRSSRQLEKECHRNVEVLWLLRKLAPDFKTIADFRRDHRAGFKLVHRQFHRLCHKLNLFGGELVAIDGTRLAAVNARDHNYNQKKLEELMARADTRLEEYLKQLDEADAHAAQAAPPLTRAALEEKIAALREKQEWHEELLAQLQESQENQLSTTDPDARKMHTAQGAIVGYNAQSAVDAKHKLIVAGDVTTEGTDLRQLGSMAVAAKQTLAVNQLEVIADQGYYNNAEVSTCVEQNITPYISKPDTSANTAQGLYAKNDFTYDAEKDIYLCPAGAELTHRFNTYELGRALRYYRATACQKCPLKTKCTRNKANRTITREEDEHLMEAMARRVHEQPAKLRQRKALVEHPFGTIKRWFGYTHFLLKGLDKVRAEWTLMTLAYNLKRVLNLVDFGPLMKAVIGKEVRPA